MNTSRKKEDCHCIDTRRNHLQANPLGLVNTSRKKEETVICHEDALLRQVYPIDPRRDHLQANPLGLVNTSRKKENVKECMRVAWDSQMDQLTSFFCK